MLEVVADLLKSNLASLQIEAGRPSGAAGTQAAGQLEGRQAAGETVAGAENMSDLPAMHLRGDPPYDDGWSSQNCKCIPGRQAPQTSLRPKCAHLCMGIYTGRLHVLQTRNTAPSLALLESSRRQRHRWQHLHIQLDQCSHTLLVQHIAR